MDSDNATCGMAVPEADPARPRRIAWAVPVAVAALIVAMVTAGSLAGGAIRTVSWRTDNIAPGLDPERDAVRKLRRTRPEGLIVVVDTARGRLRVERGGEVLRDAACSAGSGMVLVEPGNRVWVFDTPIGERRVLAKRRNPVWIKPDWAFVEEGMQPPESWRARRDDVSLGDYALSLGDGYLIHGTLFQTLLGQPVTHGCIRLGDEDLEYVWRTVGVGTRVYLF